MRFLNVGYLVLTHIALVLFAPWARAGPVAYRSLTLLTTEADAIVVGSVQAVPLAGAVSATINTEQVLKGTVTPGISIPLTWTSPQSGIFPSAPPSKSRPISGHGVFFLQRDGSGSWSILPVLRGASRSEDTYIHTPATAPAGFRDIASASLPTRASALDNVLVEIVIATEAGAPTPFDLVDNFRQSRSPVLAAAFTRFLQNPKLMAIGLRGSILSGDPSLILTIRQNYAALSSTGGWFELLQEIRTQYLNTGPQAIQILGQIATDNTVGADLRIAAAGALARMHTQQTLSYLAKLLGDQNIQLREMATGGMAAFANNVVIGTHEIAAGAWPYRTDETIAHSGFNASDFIFWQGWWQQNQSKLGQ